MRAHEKWFTFLVLLAKAALSFEVFHLETASSKAE